MTVDEQLERAIASGRDVLVVLDAGDPVVGVVEAIDDRRVDPWDGYTRRPVVVRVALRASGGVIEEIDIRRIARVVRGS